jgi:hypothetical protein
MIPVDHLCDFKRGKTWWTFIYLEERLTTISRYVTFSKSNESTWSEELASLLILSGSATNTFFEMMRKNCPYIKSVQSVIDEGKIVKKRAKEKGSPFWDINNYRDALNPIYEFSKNSVIVPFGLDDYGEIRPFAKFDSYEVPPWWTAYNKLKHDYYKDTKIYATLDNVINCLAGLLILNTLHKCSQEYLCRYRIINDKYNSSPEILIEHLSETMLGYPESTLKEPYIQTKQFIMRLREIKKK